MAKLLSVFFVPDFVEPLLYTRLKAKIKFVFHSILSLLLVLLLLNACPKSSFSNEKLPADLLAMVDEQQFDDEFFFILAEQSVTIASKSKESANKAPSIITVITAEEIENSGVRTLPDLLMMVPGFDVIKDSLLGEVYYGSRGINRSDEKIKVLINDHLINNPVDGSSIDYVDSMTLKNVKRVEIIRGPGSALYGANAFLAVINIITKDADDIDGIEVSAGFGSFDTQEYSVLFGKKYHGVEVSGFADFYNTNGLSDTIDQDVLSGIPFLSKYSLAPGDTDDSRNKLDFHIKLAYKDLEFNGKYMNKDTEPFVGAESVLTNGSEQNFNYAMADLRYKYDILDNLTVKPRFYFDLYEFGLLEEVLPDGLEVPFDLDGDGEAESFPDGANFEAYGRERRLGADIQFDHEIFSTNTLTYGFNYEWEKQDHLKFKSNIDPFTSASLGGIQDLSGTANWMVEAYRQIWAIYLQDKWDITEDLALTMGIRHDHYNDFEGTTNPRFGLVWEFMDDTTLKLLYGQAFRAPSFTELFLANNSTLLGNSSLSPELIRTYEISLSRKFVKSVKVNVNYFFNVIRDSIDVASKKSPTDPIFFENLGGSNIHGVEFEIKSDLNALWKGAYVFANYTYQDAEGKDDPLVDVPKHKGNVGINVKPYKFINANLHTFITGERKRTEQDTRDESPGFALMNLTVTAKEIFHGLSLNASLYNLLDKDYSDPSPLNTVPGDVPRPGRNFFLELEYKY